MLQRIPGKRDHTVNTMEPLAKAVARESADHPSRTKPRKYAIYAGVNLLPYSLPLTLLAAWSTIAMYLLPSFCRGPRR